MKKYIFALFIIFTGHQFFAGTVLVERWKKSDAPTARIIWKNLTEERKVELLADLIDDASDKLKQCFNDNNFLVFTIKFNLDRHLIPHHEIIDIDYFNKELIAAKFDFLFSQVYSNDDRRDIEIILSRLDLYFELLKNYVEQKHTSLKEIAEKEDILKLLSNLVDDEYALPGKFAQTDSKEQKLLKQYLLDREADLEEVESDTFTAQTVESL
ncbi:hypothetical protein KBB68_00245 [Candidatus Babeliales bacterium]|nr:hypothetical protein [Candidatus Babeliales bacterium]